MKPHSTMNHVLRYLGPSEPKGRVCDNCGKQEPSNPSPEQTLKRCARCRTSIYCSRSCQRVHWKSHKRNCSFGAIKNNCYLDTIHSQEDVMDRLIDAYRMRAEDEYNFRGEARGLYANRDPLADFRDFLDKAEAQMGKEGLDDNERLGILPSWWSKEKRTECEQRGMRQANWSCLLDAIEKPDIQKHYNDELMPMKLRMLAETVYGFNVMSR
jgi:mitochondrial splicing suppressor protein 51